MAANTSLDSGLGNEGLSGATRKPPLVHRPVAERDVPSPFDREALRGEERTAVLLIEPRVLMRECLRRCVGEAIALEIHALASLSEWLANPRSRTPTIAIVCLSGRHTSDEDDGYEDLRSLVQAYPLLPVVVIADGDRLDDVRLAMSHGAKGYIPTSTLPGVAVEAIQLVIAGGIYVPASCLLAESADPPSPAANRRKLSMFTARQAAVIEALRMGKANKMIAYELNMRESTVKVHVRNIMKRLNAKNRTEVAYLASKLMAGPAA